MITSEKKNLRRQILTQRALLTSAEKIKKSATIAKALFGLPYFNKASTLLIYLSIGDEVLTQPIIEEAWQKKKTVLIPVCLPDRNLLLSNFLSFDDVEKGYFNLFEPKPEALRPCPPTQVDLAILPGLAFDYKGNRLGYGGGYFDKLLPTLRQDCVKIALAYDFQLQNKIPVTENDVPVDIIITNQSIHEV